MLMLFLCDKLSEYLQFFFFLLGWGGAVMWKALGLTHHSREPQSHRFKVRRGQRGQRRTGFGQSQNSSFKNVMFFVNVIYISSPKEKKISKIVALQLLWWMFMTKK